MNAALANRVETVELRRYRMQPGKRDTLIDLFENVFLDVHDGCGMLAVGHYRNLDDPDEFVWFRGFRDAARRAAALDAFYTSPVWLTHRETANATMIDSDDVLLLHGATDRSGFDLRGLLRPRREPRGAPESFAGVGVFTLERLATGELVERFETQTLPLLQACAQRVVLLVTHDVPNDYPRLPVRTEPSLVVAGVCESIAALDDFSRVVSETDLRGVLTHEILRLKPAARSLYR